MFRSLFWPHLESKHSGVDFYFNNNNASTPNNLNNNEGKGEDSKDDQEKTKGGKEKKSQVGVCQMFRFATCGDIILILFGVLFASIHGSALPCMVVVFGDMTDIFVESAVYENYVALLNVTCSNTTQELGVTVDEVLKSDTAIVELVKACNFTVDEGLPDPVEILTGDHDLLGLMSTLAIYYVMIGCGVILVAYVQVAFFIIAATRQTQRIRMTLFRAIMRQEIGWFDCHEIGELNSRLSDDVNKILDGIGDKLGNFFQWTASFFAGITIAFVHGWKMTLVILGCGPVLVLVGGLRAKLTTGATTNELKSCAKAGAVAEEVFGAVKTVVAFGGQEKELKRYKAHLGEAMRFGIKNGTANGCGQGLLYFVVFCVYALAFWFGGKLVRDGEYTVGDMLTTFYSVLIGSFALGNAGPYAGAFSVGQGAAYTIWKLIDRKSEIDSFSEEGQQPSSVNGTVSLHNVRFKYPSRPDIPILNGLNLKVEVGQTAALVGSSGCGKSTVLQLLQRLYDPQEGTVKLDGRDIRNLNIGWLRRHVSVVSQEPILFATTIAENIRFGRENVTQHEIEQACRQANAYDFISKLPKKLDTLVGERGSQLSGGQKQRIAIARAMVRDPKVLLLDEATSALDTESEAIVQDALEKASSGRTTIVVAHRLSTIKNADVIFGLKNGVVHESGTHDSLMEMGESGIYYQLVTSQMMGAGHHHHAGTAKAASSNEHHDLDPEAEQQHEPEAEESNEEDIGLDTTSSGTVVIAPSNLENKAPTSKTKQAEAEVAPAKLPKGGMKRLFGMNAPELFYILCGCLGAVAAGASQPAFAIIFSEILGVFEETDAEQQKKDIEFWSTMFLLLGVATGIAFFIQGFMFSLSGEKLTKRVRGRMFKALLRQETSYFDDPDNSTGAICTRLATDASAVQGATGARLGTFFNAVASLGVAIVIGFVYSWQLTLLIFGFVPFMVIAGALQMKMLQGQAGQAREALETAGKTAVEAIENIRTVASLTKEDWFYNEYEKLTLKPYKSSLTKAHFIGITFSFTQSIIFFAYAVCFYLGAYLVEEGELVYEDMFKVFMAIIFGATAVGKGSHFAPDYGKAKVSAVKLFELLDRVPSIDSESQEGAKPSSVSGRLDFFGVFFHYPARPDAMILRGIDFCVWPGQTIALVGSSGCGKSTSISLLERFYDPTEGSVQLDGKNLKALNVQWLRQQLGLVQQEPILFATSIKENIAYGDNQKEVGMAEIIEAAKSANIHKFIEGLPDGYETNVGDKGAQLSGGQKQRVAIARALVRHPKILLLDEATSALDTESEKIVQEALDHAQKGRTSIVIAHRLSTIQHATKILVFKHGKIRESGTHGELVSKKGLYYKLLQAQQKKKERPSVQQ